MRTTSLIHTATGDKFVGEDVVATGRWLIAEADAANLDMCEEAIREIATTHRIAGRILAKLKVNPRLFSDRLRSDLAAHQRENEETIRRHGEALNTLVRDFLDPDDRVVLVKGNSCYALSGSAAAIRRSADIDYLVEKGDELAARLKEAALVPYRNVSPHELSNVMLNDVMLDLHRHYPVWSYTGAPDDVTADDVRVSGMSLRVEPLTYADFLEGAVPSSLYRHPRILQPDPATAAVVCCAHAFRDYVSRGSVTVRNRAPIRLADALEFLDYINLLTFDRTRFLSLTSRLGAGTCVSWMLDVLSVLGASTFGALNMSPQAVGNRISCVYPRSLWGSFWAKVPFTNASLFEKQTSTEEIVRGLGCTPERLNDASFSLDSTGKKSGVRWWRVPGAINEKQLEVTLARVGPNLSVDVRIEGRAAAVNERVHVDIADHALEWNRNRDTGKVTQKGTRPIANTTIEYDCDARGCTRLKASVDLKRLDLEQRDRLSFLIGAADFETAPVMRAGTLVCGILEM